jgi:hypothetical protein
VCLGLFVRPPPLEAVFPEYGRQAGIKDAQFKFNPRWFFYTIRAFRLGFAQLAEHYVDQLRQLGWLQQRMAAGDDMMRMQFSALLSYKILRDATLLDERQLTSNLRFAVFVVDWCNHVCSGVVAPSTLMLQTRPGTFAFHTCTLCYGGVIDDCSGSLLPKMQTQRRSS